MIHPICCMVNYIQTENYTLSLGLTKKPPFLFALYIVKVAITLQIKLETKEGNAL
nr:hypothetical protein [Algibacter sp. L1A34]